jgi:hypothetical protein
MDSASAFGAGGCEFESHVGRHLFLHFSIQKSTYFLDWCKCAVCFITDIALRFTGEMKTMIAILVLKKRKKDYGTQYTPYFNSILLYTNTPATELAVKRNISGPLMPRFSQVHTFAAIRLPVLECTG